MKALAGLDKLSAGALVTWLNASPNVLERDARGEAISENETTLVGIVGVFSLEWFPLEQLKILADPW